MTVSATEQAPPRLHKLKCEAPHFGAVVNRSKRNEVRLNDRNYRTGDFLLLCEVIPREEGTPEPTGREVLTQVTHVLPGGSYGIDSQHVVLSIEVVADINRA